MNLRTWLKEWLKERETRAAAKAINKTIGMFEKEFDVRARGVSPTRRRRSLINKLAWRIRRQ